MAEELQLRERYGYKTISDRTMQSLIRTKGKPIKYANDPSSYEILMNPDYVHDFGYVSEVFASVEEYQTDLTDQVVRALYGSYLTEEVSEKTDDTIKIED